MNDLIYISIVIAFFAGSGRHVRFCEKLYEETWRASSLVSIAVGLFEYLIFAMLYPGKF